MQWTNTLYLILSVKTVRNPILNYCCLWFWFIHYCFLLKSSLKVSEKLALMTSRGLWSSSFLNSRDFWKISFHDSPIICVRPLWVVRPSGEVLLIFAPPDKISIENLRHFNACFEPVCKFWGDFIFYILFYTEKFNVLFIFSWLKFHLQSLILWIKKIFWSHNELHLHHSYSSKLVANSLSILKCS